jgi:hypothetical protein
LRTFVAEIGLELYPNTLPFFKSVAQEKVFTFCISGCPLEGWGIPCSTDLYPTIRSTNFHEPRRTNGKPALEVDDREGQIGSLRLTVQEVAHPANHLLLGGNVPIQHVLPNALVSPGNR